MQGITALLAISFLLLLVIFYAPISPKKKRVLHFATLTIITILVFVSVSTTTTGLPSRPTPTTTSISFTTPTRETGKMIPVDGQMIIVTATIVGNSTSTTTILNSLFFTVKSGTFTVQMSKTITASGLAATNELLWVTYSKNSLTFFGMTNYVGRVFPPSGTFLYSYIVRNDTGFKYVVTEVFIDYSKYTVEP